MFQVSTVGDYEFVYAFQANEIRNVLSKTDVYCFQPPSQKIRKHGTYEMLKHK